MCVWVFLVRNYVRFVQYSLWVDECKWKAQAKWYFAGGEVWLNNGWLNRYTLKGCLPLHLFVFIFRNTWTPMTWSPWTWLILTQNMASSIRSSAIRGQGLRPRVSITFNTACSTVHLNSTVPCSLSQNTASAIGDLLFLGNFMSHIFIFILLLNGLQLT